MGADYYERKHERDPPGHRAPTATSRGPSWTRTSAMGDGVVIKPFPRGTEMDNGDWVVQDGIVVIPKGTILPQGTRIEPGA